jgi:hypothetical protein
MQYVLSCLGTWTFLHYWSRVPWILHSPTDLFTLTLTPTLPSAAQPLYLANQPTTTLQPECFVYQRIKGRPCFSVRLTHPRASGSYLRHDTVSYKLRSHACAWSVWCTRRRIPQTKSKMYDYFVSGNYPPPCSYLKYNVLETGFFLYLQAEATQLRHIGTDSSYLRAPAPKSKSHYDRRSIGQFVLVSCPFYSRWPDVTFIWVTITFIFFM